MKAQMKIRMKHFGTLAVLSLAVVAFTQSCSSGHDDQVAPTVGDASLFQKSNLTGRRLGLTGTHNLVLTFDDGPAPGVTNQVLDLLRDEGIHAMFFLVGKNIDGNEKLLARMRDEGHVIANHTWDHQMLVPMGRRDMAAVYREIVSTDKKISPFLSPNANFFFRAPGGGFNARGTLNATNNLNKYPLLQKYIGPIYWDIGGEIDFVNADGSKSAGNRPTSYISAAADWDCWRRNFPVASCAAAYLEESERNQGGIVLMHDRGDRNGDSRTLEMVKILIPEWKKRGYSFVTLDEIPGISSLSTGTYY